MACDDCDEEMRKKIVLVSVAMGAVMGTAIAFLVLKRGK